MAAEENKIEESTEKTNETIQAPKDSPLHDTPHPGSGRPYTLRLKGNHSMYNLRDDDGKTILLRDWFDRAPLHEDITIEQVTEMMFVYDKRQLGSTLPVRKNSELVFGFRQGGRPLLVHESEINPQF